MAKPNGVVLSESNGWPILGVRVSSGLEDKIWDAVREAICANMTPTQFKREASQAWQHFLDEDAKAARDVFERDKNY